MFPGLGTLASSFAGGLTSDGFGGSSPILPNQNIQHATSPQEINFGDSSGGAAALLASPTFQQVQQNSYVLYGVLGLVVLIALRR